MSLILMASMGLHSAVAAFDDQSSDSTRESAIRESVVKITATLRYPDMLHPWTKQSPHEASGTGVVIGGKRILTNAHVVLYASQLFVESQQSSEKLAATVEAVSPGMDLAVLKLDDESFFDKRPPLVRVQTLPEVKDSVVVYGYPQGGSSLSVTKGIVSRIEFAGYNDGVSGVRIQVDAAINPGNSGGPALVDGKMVGLIFSKLTQADNIGYIIPGEEIDLFLKDVADGKYEGKPAMHDSLQTLENHALRGFLRLDKKSQGMVVHTPAESKPDYPLKNLGRDHQDRRRGDRQRRHGEDQGQSAPPVSIFDSESGQERQGAADDHPPGQAPEHRAAGRLAVADADRTAAGPLPVVLRLRPAGLLGGKPRVLHCP